MASISDGLSMLPPNLAVRVFRLGSLLLQSVQQHVDEGGDERLDLALARNIVAQDQDIVDEAEDAPHKEVGKGGGIDRSQPVLGTARSDVGADRRAMLLLDDLPLGTPKVGKGLELVQHHTL